MERKPKYKDEVIVTFEDKATRDHVKAQAPHVADHREKAGMRLHIPDHLQQSFRSLMNLSYELKKKHPELKRTVKFDEDELDLFMDIQTAAGADWKRIGRDQAQRFSDRRKETATMTIEEDEQDGLLGST